MQVPGPGAGGLRFGGSLWLHESRGFQNYLENRSAGLCSHCAIGRSPPHHCCSLGSCPTAPGALQPPQASPHSHSSVRGRSHYQPYLPDEEAEAPGGYKTGVASRAGFEPRQGGGIQNLGLRSLEVILPQPDAFAATLGKRGQEGAREEACRAPLGRRCCVWTL